MGQVVDDDGQKPVSSSPSTTSNFVKQSEKLSLEKPRSPENPTSVAVKAKFVTPEDAVIVTADGSRLPAVPLQEAYKLNVLRDELNSEVPGQGVEREIGETELASPALHNEGKLTTKLLSKLSPHENAEASQESAPGLQSSVPPSHTNPLFPPLPPLYEEEVRRSTTRKEQERLWKRRKTTSRGNDGQECPLSNDGFIPTEGGPDPIICDVGYYARRVGLDVEEFEVQTEDGFIIDLWHVYDPKEYTKLDEADRSYQGPDPFTGRSKKQLKDSTQKRKFPVLLMHGLLQSAGAYCVNDDDSLAFYLCKSGYDVWLGNNRCGFKPKHVLLEYSDPRMWCWNIRQMGIFDLSSLTSRVIRETGFEKIGLVAHSQGTTETFVALAKEQRPELGEKLTVFCALAPAAYAGPLIGKMYFKFMRVISPSLFRMMFGIHAFIPIMMTMHSILDPRIYGWLGYKVFSFLFDWTDARWDRALKNRMFQFAPVYVSAESMRWWLGRECFAKHKCILSTKEEWRSEEREDIEGETDAPLAQLHSSDHPQRRPELSGKSTDPLRRRPKGLNAWYNEKVPPFALWVAGSDDLVNGKRLLRRFERGREPHVKVVHSKVIPEYEHLDVIWAMDAVSQVFEEVREVLWKTCYARDQCRVPTGCESVPAWTPSDMEISTEEVEQSSSDSP
ncbi:hypothetical protein E0Z10_g8874 [Xylaria hypoxylon]|uniref:Partial AB-hydrolase lipase domain-containing protein n=1 Tax=Xylaria hypoxylon TaxID=37992 RepID=A0A4Z0YLT8_9PEZI|nr:hypothetical protein E0Z10_g8874 [Xylaria hypoxylon]